MEKREVGGKFSSQVSNLGEVKAEATSRRELVQSRTRPGNSDSLSPSAEQLLILRIYLALLILPVCRRLQEVGRYCKARQGCLGRLPGHQHFQFGGCLPEVKFNVEIKHKLLIHLIWLKNTAGIIWTYVNCRIQFLRKKQLP